MNHPLPWLLAATLLLGLGFICLEAQAHFTRWKTDRELDRIAGCLWGWALVCLAGGILAAIN